MNNIISCYFSFSYLLSVQFKDDNKLFDCVDPHWLSIIYTKRKLYYITLACYSACYFTYENKTVNSLCVSSSYIIRLAEATRLWLKKLNYCWGDIMITVVVKITSRKLYRNVSPMLNFGNVCNEKHHKFPGNLQHYSTKNYFPKKIISERFGAFKTRTVPFAASPIPPYPSASVKRPSALR